MRLGFRLLLPSSTLRRLSGEFLVIGVIVGDNPHQITRHAVPFKYNLKYRSAKARSIVEQANLLHN